MMDAPKSKSSIQNLTKVLDLILLKYVYKRQLFMSV